MTIKQYEQFVLQRKDDIQPSKYNVIKHVYELVFKGLAPTVWDLAKSGQGPAVNNMLRPWKALAAGHPNALFPCAVVDRIVEVAEDLLTAASA